MSEPTSLADPLAWLAALRSAYAHSLQSGAAHWKAAEAEVAAANASADELAEAAITALEHMAEGDPTSLGMTACEVLRKHGGAAQLDRLRAIRARLPARKGLRDWRVDADHARAVIEARVSGGCTCDAEARSGAAWYGAQWQVEDERSDPEQYCVRAVVRCTHCGKRWSVRREDGYHYPIFAWTSA